MVKNAYGVISHLSSLFSNWLHHAAFRVKQCTRVGTEVTIQGACRMQTESGIHQISAFSSYHFYMRMFSSGVSSGRAMDKTDAVSGNEKKKKSAKQTHDWTFLFQATSASFPLVMGLCTPAQLSPSRCPHNTRRAPLSPAKSPRSSMEGPVVPPSEGWSCQLQGWRIWGWLSGHSELGRGLEKCKLGLHKTLTHAEKSRVLKVSAEEWAKPQTGCCLQIDRNRGNSKDLWKSDLGAVLFEVLPLLPGGTESHVHLSGGKYDLCYFKGKQCGHFSFTHWKELLKAE